jgi:hypothetical protein
MLQKSDLLVRKTPVFSGLAVMTTIVWLIGAWPSRWVSPFFEVLDAALIASCIVACPQLVRRHRQYRERAQRDRSLLCAMGLEAVIFFIPAAAAALALPQLIAGPLVGPFPPRTWITEAYRLHELLLSLSPGLLLASVAAYSLVMSRVGRLLPSAHHPRPGQTPR